jgi:streptogramin lyase
MREWSVENLEGRQLLSQGIARFPIPGSVAGYATSGEIAPGSDGNVWVTDNNSDISKITPRGKVTTYNLPANSSVHNLTLGPDGNIWFVDYNFSPNTSTNAIGRITPGGVVTEFPQPIFINALASGPDGNLWFTGIDSQSNFVGHITPSGHIEESAIGSSQSLSLGNLAADRAGNLWIATESYSGDISVSRLLRISPSGDQTMIQLPEVKVRTAPGKPAQSVRLSFLGYLSSDLTRGPDGDVWFTAEANSSATSASWIGSVSPSGRFTIFRVLGSKGESIPGQIATGPGKSLFFGVTDTNFDIGPNPKPILGKITTTGKLSFTRFSQHRDRYGVNLGIGVNALTTGPDGNLWIVTNHFATDLAMEVDRLALPHGHPQRSK